ncbi:MAG: TIGR02281 family clan AA aspartic protease [Betaproteobacteria bacterium]|nr:TIGR02281 family clan AA aspartic protease [Betaproteobacteria bacterium]
MNDELAGSRVPADRSFPSAFRPSLFSFQRGSVAKLALVWLVIIGALYWFFFVWYERVHNPNPAHVLEAQPAGEVVLQRNRAGQYIAEGAINGAPAIFLVDTGATYVSLPMPLARRLALKLGPPVQVQTAAGPATAYPARLASVRLAAIEMREVSALVTEGMEGDTVLLGMNFLKRLEMTQRGDRLILRSPQPGS